MRRRSTSELIARFHRDRYANPLPYPSGLAAAFSAPVSFIAHDGQHIVTLGIEVREYRRRLRARGYRPVQIWLPDVRTEEFAAEARRQALLVALEDRHSDDQDFVEEVSAPWDDE